MFFWDLKILFLKVVCEFDFKRYEYCIWKKICRYLWKKYIIEWLFFLFFLIFKDENILERYIIVLFRNFFLGFFFFDSGILVLLLF